MKEMVHSERWRENIDDLETGAYSCVRVRDFKNSRFQKELTMQKARCESGCNPPPLIIDLRYITASGS